MADGDHRAFEAQQPVTDAREQDINLGPQRNHLSVQTRKQLVYREYNWVACRAGFRKWVFPGFSSDGRAAS